MASRKQVAGAAVLGGGSGGLGASAVQDFARASGREKDAHLARRAAGGHLVPLTTGKMGRLGPKVRTKAAVNAFKYSEEALHARKVGAGKAGAALTLGAGAATLATRRKVSKAGFSESHEQIRVHRRKASNQARVGNVLDTVGTGAIVGGLFTNLADKPAKSVGNRLEAKATARSVSEGVGGNLKTANRATKVARVGRGLARPGAGTLIALGAGGAAIAGGTGMHIASMRRQNKANEIARSFNKTTKGKARIKQQGISTTPRQIYKGVRMDPFGIEKAYTPLAQRHPLLRPASFNSRKQNAAIGATGGGVGGAIGGVLGGGGRLGAIAGGVGGATGGAIGGGLLARSKSSPKAPQLQNLAEKYHKNKYQAKRTDDPAVRSKLKAQRKDLRHQGRVVNSPFSKGMTMEDPFNINKLGTVMYGGATNSITRLAKVKNGKPAQGTPTSVKASQNGPASTGAGTPTNKGQSVLSGVSKNFFPETVEISKGSTCPKCGHKF